MNTPSMQMRLNRLYTIKLTIIQEVYCFKGDRQGFAKIRGLHQAVDQNLLS